MLRQVYIILNDNIIYQRNYAKGLDNSLFSNIFVRIKKAAFSKFENVVGSFEFFELNLTFISEKSINIIFLLVSGLGDALEDIKPQLFKFKKEFLDFYGDSIKDINLTLIADVMDPIVDAIHRNLKPKISIIGFSGVGKTTTTQLIKAEELPMQHIPTITGEVVTIKIGKLEFFLWDFAGQDQFDFLWEKFIRGSDAVLLMTNSTLANIDKSRYFLELANKIVPYARLAVIANKQDLPEAMKVKDIERLMDKKTYSMVAIEPRNRTKMIRIIADILDMDPQVSPLLKPLFERDILIDKAQNNLKKGFFNEVVDIFDEISNLCIDLGDDSLAIEFQKKAERLRKMLESVNN